MPNIHLGNGDVLKVSNDELAELFDETGSRSVIHKDGYEHIVIGVYSDPIKLKDEDKKADNRPEALRGRDK